MPQNSDPIWGKALACLHEGGMPTLVPVGIVRPMPKGTSGELEFTMLVEPLAWRDLSYPRRIVLRKEEVK